MQKNTTFSNFLIYIVDEKLYEFIIKETGYWANIGKQRSTY